MTTKVWNVGDVLTAADMNVWTVPLAAVKPADTGRASNTTITNDPDLQLSLAASSTYDVRAVIQYKGATLGTGDGQIQLNAPAAATGFMMRGAYNTALALGLSMQALGASAGIGTSGTGTLLPLLISASVTTSGAGTLAIAWAQNTSNATATTFMAGSYLVAQRIA